MLIQRLESIRENLTNKRMFLAAKHEQAKGFSRGYYRFALGDLATIESKIIWILIRLSYLCSSLRALLVDLDHRPGRIEERTHDIRMIMEEISMPEDVSKLISKNRPIQKLDAWFMKNPNLSGRVAGEMYARKLTIKRYAGAIPELIDEPKVTLQEVTDLLCRIKNVDLRSTASINAAIHHIGKEDAIEFRQACADEYSKRRLN